MNDKKGDVLIDTLLEINTSLKEIRNQLQNITKTLESKL